MQTEKLIAFTTEHWALCAGFVVILVMWLQFEIRQKLTGITFLSAQQATNLYNNDQGLLIDTRAASAFKKGHVPGAINKASDQLLKNTSDLPKDKTLILIDSNGQSVLKTANLLSKQGFANLCILKDGINGWESANFPLVTS